LIGCKEKNMHVDPILFGPGFALQQANLDGRAILLQSIVKQAPLRSILAGWAQHKPPLQPRHELSLQLVRQFFEDAEYETTVLLHRPSL
jgi:hypothetical protein